MLKQQPLNYTPKAIVALEAAGQRASALGRSGFRYLARKLREAEVFILPEYGQLLDRAKVRPEVPSIMFRPPFPVVALEYAAPREKGWVTPGYTDAPCSRRIALAWDWRSDLPPVCARILGGDPGPGVVVATIAYYDQQQAWLPVFGGLHIPYDVPWSQPEVLSPFAVASAAAGRSTPKQLAAPRPASTPIPFLPEVLAEAGDKLGVEGMFDMLSADLSDEVNAYLDMCLALACKNVTAERHVASKALNLCRQGRKPPLKDFHLLTLGDGDGGGEAFGGVDRAGPRSHLRRGHIRRLGPDRITWVNQTMVHGRGGFVDKQYAIGAGR